KMAPKKRTTRASPATTTTTTTTPVTNAQLKALIDQGVADALAARDADKSMNGDDSHNLVTGVRRQAALAREMFPKESDKIKKYVGGLPDMIHGSVMASKPKTMQDAIEFATELMDKKISTLAEHQAKNKRKLDNNNHARQQPPKKHGVAIAYTVRFGERKEYGGTLPLCNKCKFHHNGQCTIKCADCNTVGHLTQDCRSLATTNNQRNLTCYKCRNQGYYKSDCPELKNQNYKNQAEGTEAHGMDFLARHILLRCDSSGDLYPVTKPSTVTAAFVSTSSSTWHQRLGHPGDDVLRSLSSRHLISCNKERSPHVCHACQLGKHVKLPFHSSISSVKQCFDIIHSDLWTSPI
ncbi:reverse transcriptase domain-containing protein, partial [Tanacetum coccineum]